MERADLKLDKPAAGSAAASVAPFALQAGVQPRTSSNAWRIADALLGNCAVNIKKVPWKIKRFRICFEGVVILHLCMYSIWWIEWVVDYLQRYSFRQVHSKRRVPIVHTDKSSYTACTNYTWDNGHVYPRLDFVETWRHTVDYDTLSL